MSQNKVNVKVKWQGKKLDKLPTGLKYITVAKFDLQWLKDAWSIVIEFVIPPFQQGSPSEGMASFLMPNAPINKLVSGISFDLYEGKDITARVEII